MGITEVQVRPLTAEDIDRAARVVAAMSRVECLRGGVACFGRELEAQGWHHADSRDFFAVVIVPVGDAEDLDFHRQAVRRAVEVARAEVRVFVADSLPRDRPELEHELRALEIVAA